MCAIPTDARSILQTWAAKAMELYIDREGRYFFAEYTNWEGAKDRITPVVANDAAAFIERYGTELHKKPKEPEAEEHTTGTGEQ